MGDEDLTDDERRRVSEIEAEIERLLDASRLEIAPLRAELVRIRTRGRVRKARAKP